MEDKMAVRTMKGNPAASLCYIKESRAYHKDAKAMEEDKNLNDILEELFGVRGAECYESCRRNKGGLMGFRVHNPDKFRYKSKTKSGKTPHEESEEAIVPVTPGTTQPRVEKGLCFNNAERGGK